MKKLFALGGIALMSFSLIGASLASVSYVAAYAEDLTPDIEESKPLADLLKNDKFRALYAADYYRKDTSVNINNDDAVVPMQFTEWHWGYTDYSLYFYVWNRSQFNGFDLSSQLNSVTIQNNETGSYYQYPIKFISRNDDQFYKFKIKFTGLDNFTFMNSVGARVYTFGQLMLKQTDSLNGLATSYVFSKKYTYSGALSSDSLIMNEEEIETLSINVKGGTYSTQPSGKDIFRHSDLHYVYFDIPNTYLSKYGEVAEYHFTYHPIPLAPIMAIKGETVNQTTINNAANVNAIPTYGNNQENFYGKYQWFSANGQNYYHATYSEYAFSGMYIDNLDTQASGVLAARTLTCCAWMATAAAAVLTNGLATPLFLADIALSGNTDAYRNDQWDYVRSMYIPEGYNAIPLANARDDVTSAVMDNYINLNNLENFSEYHYNEQLQNDYSTFSAYFNAMKVEEHLRYDQQNYKLRTFKKDGRSFTVDGLSLEKSYSEWDAFAEGNEEIKPIERITSSNSSTDEETWKLEPGTGSQFHSDYVSATNSGKTPYIFRFAPTSSVVYPIYWTELGTENDWLGMNELAVKNDCERVGTSYTGFGIYDLVSLDLTFTKNGVETIIPIAADPTNINPAIEHAEASAEDKTDIWAKILKILSIALIVIGAILALWLLLKIIGWFRNAFKS